MKSYYKIVVPKTYTKHLVLNKPSNTYQHIRTRRMERIFTVENTHMVVSCKHVDSITDEIIILLNKKNYVGPDKLTYDHLAYSQHKGIISIHQYLNCGLLPIVEAVL